MDGLDFFVAQTGLQVPSHAAKLGQHRCPHCGREKVLWRMRKLIGCAACYTIRMGYGAEKLPLTGTYGLITDDGGVFYTNRKVAGLATRPPLEGGFYELLTQLIRDPPPRYLVVRFGKATNTRTFRLNTKHSRDFIFISGATFIGTLNASSIQAWLIRRLLQHPLSRREWEQIIAARRQLHDQRYGEAAAKICNSLQSQYPGLPEHLPWPSSIEARLLEICADASPRSETRSHPARRRSG